MVAISRWSKPPRVCSSIQSHSSSSTIARRLRSRTLPARESMKIARVEGPMSRQKLHLVPSASVSISVANRRSFSVARSSPRTLW